MKATTTDTTNENVLLKMKMTQTSQSVNKEQLSIVAWDDVKRLHVSWGGSETVNQKST